MSYKLILTTITLATITLGASGLMAQSEPTATPTNSPVIDDIRQAVRDRVQDRIDDVVYKPTAILGILTEITDSTISIQETDDEAVISTTEDTAYIRIPGRRPQPRDDLELGNHLLILGRQESGRNAILADEVQVIPEPEIPDRRLVIGRASEITTTSLLLDVINPESAQWVITLNRSTDYFQLANQTITPLTRTDLEDQNFLLISGAQDEDRALTIQAHNVVIIPTPLNQRDPATSTD